MEVLSLLFKKLLLFWMEPFSTKTQRDPCEPSECSFFVKAYAF